MSESKKFAFDVSITFLSSLINMFLGFIITVILGRYLGAEDLGLFRMTSTIYGFILLSAAVGIPAAVIKYVAEFKDDRSQISRIISSCIITALFIGIAFIPLLYLSSDALAKTFNMPDISGLLKISSFVFPFALVVGVLNGLLNGLREMKKLAWAMIMQSTLLVSITFLLIYYGFGVSGAIVGVVLSSVITCLILIYISKKYYFFTLNDYFKTTKMMFSFSANIFSANVINQINNQQDIIIIGFFLASTDVGHYSIALGLCSFFAVIPSSVQKITYPATSLYWSKNNFNALNYMINKSIKYCTAILVPIGLVFGFLAEEIITIIYKQEFIVASLPLQILLIGTIIKASIYIPIGGSLAGIGKAGIDVKLYAIITIINTILNIILIPKFGIVGASIATTISLTAATFSSLYYVRKYINIKFDYFWFLNMLAVILMSTIIFKFGMLFINPFLLAGIILIGYSILIFRFFLDNEDFIFFKSLFDSIIYQR